MTAIFNRAVIGLLANAHVTAAILAASIITFFVAAAAACYWLWRAMLYLAG